MFSYLTWQLGCFRLVASQGINVTAKLAGGSLTSGDHVFACNRLRGPRQLCRTVGKSLTFASPCLRSVVSRCTQNKWSFPGAPVLPSPPIRETHSNPNSGSTHPPHIYFCRGSVYLAVEGPYVTSERETPPPLVPSLGPSALTL